ncbi:MAG: type II secretion system inner membrane protein GspF [Halofilum sp. (in: g-proteobacteria)]|nr:type II secretion system inner membrane protein GspF [Halofilum sp. (in: g-proteobacteria)]
MSAFEYIAFDAAGRRKRGTIEGDTARQVRQQLRDQGLTPLQVEAAAEREARDRPAPGRSATLRRARRINGGDLALITRQLATLVASGSPVEDALRAASRQTERPRVERLLMAVRARVLEGYSLAAALAAFPRSFPEIYVASIRAGEQSGHLDAVLARLADYTEAQQETRASVGATLAYPIVLAVVALAIVVGLLTYIVPEVVGVFDALDAELPWLTRALIALSDFIRTWGPALLILIVVLIVAGRQALRRPAIRYRADARILRLPVVGKLVRGADTGRFARTLSILAGSGVPVLEALGITASVVNNRPMREAVERAAVQVREGMSLHRALESSGRFPPMALHLIASGEQSGQLDTMLHRAAEHHERETRVRVSMLTSMLEPAVILVAGGVVMLIVLAVLLPIFELNQLVR